MADSDDQTNASPSKSDNDNAGPPAKKSKLEKKELRDAKVKDQLQSLKNEVRSFTELGVSLVKTVEATIQSYGCTSSSPSSSSLTSSSASSSPNEALPKTPTRLASHGLAHKAPFTRWSEGGDLHIWGSFQRIQGGITMFLKIQNRGMVDLKGLVCHLNQNMLGLEIDDLWNAEAVIPSNCSIKRELKVKSSAPMTGHNLNLEGAILYGTGRTYYKCSIPLYVLFTEDARIDFVNFIDIWTGVAQNEQKHTLIIEPTLDQITSQMYKNNVYTVPSLSNLGIMYQSMKVNKVWALMKVELKPGTRSVNLTLKCDDIKFADEIFQAYEDILRST